MKDYFGLYVDSTSLTNPKLINHINNCNLNCYRMSYGGAGVMSDITDVFNHRSKLAHIQKIALILVLPDEYLSNSNLNNDEMYKNCIGHCYIFYDDNRKLLTIFDVCIHQHVSTSKNPPVINKLRTVESFDERNITYTKNINDDVFFTPDNKDYSDRKKYSGWGSVLIDAVLNTISIKFDSNILIWLGIDTQNNSFEEASNLYIKYGFKNPFLTNVDPSTNFKFPSLCIGLTKINEFELPTKNERQQVFLNILYIFDQYIKSIKTNVSACSLNVYFDEVTVKWLYSLLSKKVRNDGVLYIKDLQCVRRGESKCSIKNSDTSKYFWEVTKTNQSSELVNKITNLLSNKNVYLYENFVKELSSIMTFDVHQPITFIVYPCSDNINKPTVADYVSLIVNSNLCRCVVIKDGVYFISFSKDVCSNDKYINFIKQVDINIMRNVFEKVFSPITHSSPLDYANKVNGLILEDIKVPIFNCTFVDWNQLADKTSLNLYYLSQFKQCYYIKPITRAIIDKIYTVDGVLYPNLVE